jgi:hypothetical protein
MAPMEVPAIISNTALPLIPWASSLFLINSYIDL